MPLQLDMGWWMLIILTPVICGILAVVFVAALVGPKKKPENPDA